MISQGGGVIMFLIDIFFLLLALVALLGLFIYDGVYYAKSKKKKGKKNGKH